MMMMRRLLLRLNPLVLVLVWLVLLVCLCHASALPAIQEEEEFDIADEDQLQQHNHELINRSRRLLLEDISLLLASYDVIGLCNPISNKDAPVFPKCTTATAAITSGSIALISQPPPPPPPQKPLSSPTTARIRRQLEKYNYGGGGGDDDNPYYQYYKMDDDYNSQYYINNNNNNNNNEQTGNNYYQSTTTMMMSDTTTPSATQQQSEQQLAGDDDEEEEFFWSYYFLHASLTIICVVVGAIASGLYVGMLSLDPLVLVIKSRTAKSEKQRKRLDRLLATIKQRHQMVVTLLIVSVVAAEAMPIFLQHFVHDGVAIVASVVLVLIFGEIVPALIFTGSDQVDVACRLAPIVRMLMCLLYPLVYPIAYLLEVVSSTGDANKNTGSSTYWNSTATGGGEDTDPILRGGTVYSRGELAALIRVQYEERRALRQQRKRAQAAAAAQKQAAQAQQQHQQQQQQQQEQQRTSGGNNDTTLTNDLPSNNNNTDNSTDAGGTNTIATTSISNINIESTSLRLAMNPSSSIDLLRSSNNTAGRPTNIHASLMSIDSHDVTMLEGALQLKTKTALDIYRSHHEVFSIPHDMVLDESNIFTIYASGYSRVPVFVDGDRRKVKGILMTRQLMVVKPTPKPIPFMREAATTAAAKQTSSSLSSTTPPPAAAAGLADDSPATDNTNSNDDADPDDRDDRHHHNHHDRKTNNIDNSNDADDLEIQRRSHTTSSSNDSSFYYHHPALSDLSLHKPRCVAPDTNLVALITLFQSGGRNCSKTRRPGHMALVCARPQVGNAALDSGEALPEKAGLMGIITLEDVLEALLQDQIYDEMDSSDGLCGPGSGEDPLSSSTEANASSSVGLSIRAVAAAAAAAAVGGAGGGGGGEMATIQESNSYHQMPP